MFLSEVTAAVNPAMGKKILDFSSSWSEVWEPQHRGQRKGLQHCAQIPTLVPEGDFGMMRVSL